MRISPEKQPQTFVSIAAALSQQGTFKRLGLQPVLLAASSSSYAQEVVQEFKEKVPEGHVEQNFMNALELAALFARTAMNVDSCEYDAYGMTVVEAASLASAATEGATPLTRATYSSHRPFCSST